MCKAVTWFVIGYLAHKYGLPIANEVARQTRKFWDETELVS